MNYIPGNIPPGSIATYQNNPKDLGQGTRNLGFGRPATLMRQSNTGGGLLVQRLMNALQSPQVFAPPTVTAVALRGNGVYLSGQVVMTRLADFNKSKTQG